LTKTPLKACAVIFNELFVPACTSCSLGHFDKYLSLRP
jgi:hypothetical protein